jgi:Na+-driven multidrug efflux pump
MLIVARLLAFLAIATLGGAVLAYLFTRDRRWLRFAHQVLRLAAVAGIVIALLYVLERLL